MTPGTASTTCSYCKHENLGRNNFCTQCGSKLLPDQEAKPRLCILYGQPHGAVFLLRKGRTTIGHDPGNIVVLGDQHISNKHAAIKLEDGCFWIEDRLSKNGTHVNGQRIMQRTPLANGSVIKLGSTILKFEDGNQSQIATS